MSAERRADIEEVERALGLLVDEGQVVELRALEVPDRGRARTFSGYFNSIPALAGEAVKLSGRAKGVYITINVLDPSLLARRANRAEAVGDKEPTTGDSNVVRRRWLLVDVDPSRPAGISSSDGEHETALARARQIRESLRESGWPEPLFGDSGNGGHLLYRIDLPADDGGLVKRCLEALHERFGDDEVKVDRTVHNPARIWKLYGTLCCKGDNLPERPHRVARVLDVPDELVVVAPQLLEALAGPMTALTKLREEQPIKKVRDKRFDLAAWIARHGLDVQGPEPWQGGQMWTFKVCPWNPDHQDTAAFVAQLESGALSAGCHHDGCSGNDWFALKGLFEGADATDDADDADDGKRASSGSQASKILRLADQSGAELWHTPAGDTYVTATINGHRETFALRGKRADQWLRLLFFRAYPGTAPGTQAVNDALNVLRSKAAFDGPSDEVFVRLGKRDDYTYLDLGDEQWRALRVGRDGWEVVQDCPVRFRRSKGMLALPLPRRGGEISALRRFVNVADDDDFRLLLTAMVSMFWAKGPYPVVVLQGEQGSAKSTTGRVLTSLVDPVSTPLRAQPRDGRDLMIAATNRWLLTFDNLSDVPTWLSDALCRLATGGGYATRELYSDDEEMLFDAQRPVVLTGIEDLVTRSDLLDRAMLFILPHITEEGRQDEESFWQDFERARPYLLGALLDCVVEAIRSLPHLRLGRLPRLADFARRGAAAAPAVGWTAEQFLLAYDENRKVGNVTALEASAVAQGLIALLTDEDEWCGTATELLEALNAVVAEGKRKARSWPRSARSLANALRRVTPNLRATGIEVVFERDSGKDRARLIRVRHLPDDSGSPSSVASVSSGSDSNGADDSPDEGLYRPHPSSDESRYETDAADAADDVAERFSGNPRAGTPLPLPWEPPNAGATASPAMPSAGAFRRCPRCGERPAPPDALCFRCQAVAE